MKRRRLPVLWCAVHAPTGSVRDFKRRRDCSAFLREHPRYVGVRLVKLRSGDWEPGDDPALARTSTPC